MTKKKIEWHFTSDNYTCNSSQCPECKKGYLSHREYLQDDSKIVMHVHRDFCSNPFCDYDHKTRSIHLG